MRVYQINVVCGSGSTGRIATDISLMLKENGHQCRIAYGRGTAPKELDAIKISGLPDNYAHAFLTRITDRHGLYSVRATKRLLKDIEQFEPDIIHLHNIHGYYVNYKMLFAFLKGYGKPVIWTMHDCWAFTGHCAHYESVGCMKWREGCENCPNISAYPATLCKTQTHDNYNKKKAAFTGLQHMTVVTPSAWLGRQIENSFLASYRCITIPNGVDLDKFEPKQSDLKQKLGCGGRKLLLGVASVWTKNKGYQDFLALRKILERQYMICMVGLNEKQMRTLPEGIIGVRRTESVEELAQYYSAADVFLNLTYEDTFPTTNIEALACGTPVITYRTGGSPEILGEGCGKAVEKGDLDCLMKEIGIWSERDCASQCRERAMQYDREECYRKYIHYYHTLV